MGRYHIESASSGTLKVIKSYRTYLEARTSTFKSGVYKVISYCREVLIPDVNSCYVTLYTQEGNISTPFLK